MNFKLIHIAACCILLIAVSGCKTSSHVAKNSGDKSDTKLTTTQKVGIDRAFMEGQRAKAIEDYDEAQKKFQEVITMDPKNAAAHFELALMLYNGNKFDEALTESETAVKLAPTNKWYLEQLAAIHMKKNNAKEAISDYTQLIKVSPNDPDNYFDLAYLYMQTNQIDQAIKTYDLFEKNYGLEESIVLQKERLYLKQNKFDLAVVEVQKLIDAYPGEVQYMGMLAELYSLNNKKDKANEIYQKILEIEPDNAQALIATADINAAKGDSTARFESMKKIFANPKVNIDTKIKMLYPYVQYYELKKDKMQDAFDLAKILVETHPGQAKAYAIQGDLYYIDKKDSLALPAYLKALDLQKEVFTVWQQVMLIYNAARDWEKLDKLTTSAMELFPNQAIIYLFKGGAQFQLKQYEKSVKTFTKAEKMAADNPQLKAQIYSNLGDAYHSLNNDGASDSAYEHSLKLDPENAYVLNNYSYYLSLRKTNLQRAKQMSAYANKLDPDNDSFMDTYAWILFQLGEFTEAKVFQDRAVLKNPGNPTLLEHYGDILIQMGEKDKAVEYWRKAKDLGSDSKTIDSKIAALKYVE
ncbi:MAG: tetratricopeptide repeat protein [Bacteroidetes bacterium]|nr:tetratricopeptide repeat protein [Bacteroidota bacterium]